jgi:phosphoribosylformimino-5-aminoimidazole carboxamide ribotide isomerase
LKIIPVIDILNGVVVHAVRGSRSQYQPLKSVLTDSTNPLTVAETFKNLGFSNLYIADLDAIIDCSSNFDPLEKVAQQTGLKLMVDAGVTSIERAQSLLCSSVAKVVVGTETLPSKGFVAEAVRVFRSDRVIVSLDMKGGKVLAKPGFDGCQDPLCLLKEFRDMDVSQIILLDLSRVGSGEGLNVAFLKKALAEVSIDIYVGGGVRDMMDLLELRDLGVAGVLVASALHSGKVTVEQLKEAGLL